MSGSGLGAAAVENKSLTPVIPTDSPALFLQSVSAQAIAGAFTWAALIITGHQVTQLSQSLLRPWHLDPIHSDIYCVGVHMRIWVFWKTREGSGAGA